MFKKILLTLILFAPATSYSFDYQKAINLSGKQRMLTQKMSKEVLLVALDIDKEANLKNLKATHDLFDKTLKGLKDGDASLGLDATKKPKIKKQLDKVAGLWADFSKPIQGVISAGSASADQVGAVASNNINLLKEMNKAVKFYETDAAGKDVNPALAVAINLSGKQRMLTQKMTKEYLLVLNGTDADANKENLKGTVGLFDKTLNGLIAGDDSLGLPAAPNDEIKAQLEKVKGMWAGFKSQIEAGESAKQQVANDNLPLLKEMNAAVQMYEKL